MARVALPRVLIVFFIPVLLLFGAGLAFGPLGSSFLGKEPPGLLKVSKPHVILPAETVLHVSHFPVTNTLIASWLTMVVLVGASYLAIDSWQGPSHGRGGGGRIAEFR
jgi:hypothetical protein